MADYTYADIAKMIDHALLSPKQTVSDFEAGIEMALAYDVASVCIMPYAVRRCAERLKDSTVKTSTTIGFPNGGHTTETKTAEAQQSLADGCEELDMVVNISQVLSGDWDYVARDIAAVAAVTHDAGQKLKVIFETCYLDELQKIRLCEICTELKVDWVKTSTGFGSAGATAEDLKLMRSHCGDDVQVKASGGVRDLDTVLAYRDLGVTRCGASGTAEILSDARKRLGLPPIQTAVTRASGY